MCNYCKKLDDLIHFFISCNKASTFWQDLVKWWNKNSILKIEIQRNDFIENIIFGFMDMEMKLLCLNYIVYYAKYFIYVNKQFNKNDVDFYRFYRS